MTEFSNCESERAYWEAVERAVELRNAPKEVQEARRRALLRWVPSDREKRLAATIRVRADKDVGVRTPQWIVDLAEKGNGKLVSEPCLLEKEFPMNDYTGVTTDEHGGPTLKPTAKVRNGAIAGIGLAVGVAVLSAVTPQMLEGLGSWGVLIYAGIVALGSSLAAYMTKPTGIG